MAVRRWSHSKGIAAALLAVPTTTVPTSIGVAAPLLGAESNSRVWSSVAKSTEVTNPTVWQWTSSSTTLLPVDHEHLRGTNPTQARLVTVFLGGGLGVRVDEQDAESAERWISWGVSADEVWMATPEQLFLAPATCSSSIAEAIRARVRSEMLLIDIAVRGGFAFLAPHHEPSALHFLGPRWRLAVDSSLGRVELGGALRPGDGEVTPTSIRLHGNEGSTSWELGAWEWSEPLARRVAHSIVLQATEPNLWRVLELRSIESLSAESALQFVRSPAATGTWMDGAHGRVHFQTVTDRRRSPATRSKFRDGELVSQEDPDAPLREWLDARQRLRRAGRSLAAAVLLSAAAIALFSRLRTSVVQQVDHSSP